MSFRKSALVFAVSLACAATSTWAAAVFPVKQYDKPDDPILVRFVNEKGEEGRKAVEALGAEAGKLDALFAPAAANDIAADGKAAFKIYSNAGEEQKLESITPGADGTVDLAKALPKIKDGGTYFLVWKDAPPLVIETLFNPGRGQKELDARRSRLDALPPDQKKEVLANYAPTATHIEMASYAVITTDKGVIKAKFAYADAPHTVDNFISLSRQGFYDGSGFHRILSGFMIQGGDSYKGDQAGTGGPGYGTQHEFSDKKHLRGTLSMARSSPQDGSSNALDPTGSAYYDSAGSQFFIMHQAAPYLDGQYSAFGDVFEGLDVVDKIAATPSEPKTGKVTGAAPTIVSITILPATADMYVPKK